MTNVAVKVDGKRPIGARARRIRQPRIVLFSHSQGRNGGVSTLCESLDDMRDYCQPQAPGGGRAPHTARGTVPLEGRSARVCVCVCYRSPAEGRVCVQRCGVSLLRSVSGRSADGALGGGLGDPQLVDTANGIRTG